MIRSYGGIIAPIQFSLINPQSIQSGATMEATITLLPGDGIGPEVVAEGQKVLEVVADRFGHTFTFTEALVGGIAIDETGDPLPDETLAGCRAGDAVLLGAVGGPKWSDPSAPVRPEQGLLRLRKELGLFANLRPVKVVPALAGASALKPDVVSGVDLVIVRELTGGLYFGQPQGRRDDENGRTAVDTLNYTETEIERLMRVAFDLARMRRNKVTSVDKANVLASSRLWREVAHEVAHDYPDVEYEDMLVDACAMYLIRRPADFDVVATENMFGDILSDEASMLAGSLGMLPSASLGSGPPGVFEPIHGSAPDIAGQGIANPLATILSVAMLLRSGLGLTDEAAAVERAVEGVLAAGHRTADLAGPGQPTVSTQAMGALVVARVGP
jgi:3-isopropylmalate dehydrogenase